MTGRRQHSGAPGHAPAFRPAAWLPGPHLQTVFGPLFRRPARLPLRRERWELPDGDFLDVDRLSEAPAAAAAAGSGAARPTGAGGSAPAAAAPPLLLVLHGLEGSSGAAYARGLLREAARRGWPAAAPNFRSCSGEPNRLPRSYHSGETGDLDLVVARLRAERPGAPIAIAGVSLGGNALVKWLGEQGDRVPPEVKAAAAICVPFDLSRCADALDGPGFWALAYRSRFLLTLLRKARGKAARHPQAIAPASLHGIRRLRDFDERVTGPVHGFAGADDYYRRSSGAQFVPAVRVPLLLIAAGDDPFIPPDSLPLAAAAANPCVALEVHAHGGHVGFVAGPPWRPRYFAEERAGEWLAGRLGEW